MNYHSPRPPLTVARIVCLFYCRFASRMLIKCLQTDMQNTSRRRTVKRKKSSTAAADTLVFTLSDLEEDRTPTKIVLDKVSKDRRRVLRQFADVNVCSTDSETNPQTDVDGRIDGFVDLANIDIDAVRTSIRNANEGTTDDNSRKKRYISSVGSVLLRI